MSLQTEQPTASPSPLLSVLDPAKTVLIVGVEGVGKTTLLAAWLQRRGGVMELVDGDLGTVVKGAKPNDGVRLRHAEWHTIIHMDDEVTYYIVIDANDTGNSLKKYTNADAILVVFSLDDYESFAWAKFQLDVLTSLPMQSKPIIAIANKCDVDSAYTQLTESDILQISSMCGVTMFRCGSKYTSTVRILASGGCRLRSADGSITTVGTSGRTRARLGTRLLSLYEATQCEGREESKYTVIRTTESTNLSSELYTIQGFPTVGSHRRESLVWENSSSIQSLEQLPPQVDPDRGKDILVGAYTLRHAGMRLKGRGIEAVIVKPMLAFHRLGDPFTQKEEGLVVHVARINVKFSVGVARITLSSDQSGSGQTLQKFTVGGGMDHLDFMCVGTGVYNAFIIGVDVFVGFFGFRTGHIFEICKRSRSWRCNLRPFATCIWQSSLEAGPFTLGQMIRTSRVDCCSSEKPTHNLGSWYDQCTERHAKVESWMTNLASLGGENGKRRNLRPHILSTSPESERHLLLVLVPPESHGGEAT
ncbi:hypothetical protein FA13DRAFT_1711524 [Coprinellus micaceus]|uniref:P-loop containing nucleoside triphosphate hydrolase protein n=1 Tax=Coprinellus micaceus TaxID=71717 RepID=A0A4Y7T3X4_COPMI|nr:hypothetical protein FA13DRAFT_1711524 [Coprinellus micaceus]